MYSCRLLLFMLIKLGSEGKLRFDGACYWCCVVQAAAAYPMMMQSAAGQPATAAMYALSQHTAAGYPQTAYSSPVSTLQLVIDSTFAFHADQSTCQVEQGSTLRTVHLPGITKSGCRASRFPCKLARWTTKLVHLLLFNTMDK
jgi:hypothetical protein